jgi:hypothetical protein
LHSYLYIYYNTALNEELYKSIRILAFQRGVNANGLIEEGMKYIIERESKKNKS